MSSKYILNPDKEVVDSIRRELKENGGYCPCALIKSKDTKCPCLNKRKYNECECGLYINEED